jgi:hypothetical protein
MLLESKEKMIFLQEKKKCDRLLKGQGKKRFFSSNSADNLAHHLLINELY